MNRLILRLGRNIGIVLLVLVALVGGYFLRAWLAPEKPAEQSRNGMAAAPSKVQWWTCSMHPQIRQPKAGKCPICSMDLIPIQTGGDDAGPRTLSVSPAAMELMDIQTSAVERRFVEARVRMPGKVEYDETKLAYITAWVPGRIDRLYVDYTGVTVRPGDHMVYLYSPELLATQEELLQALKAVEDLKASKIDIMRETAGATVEAAREKLRLLGLKPEQIAEIEQRGKPTEHVTIYAPTGGIVIHKNAQQGMYVTTGTRIYTIADLSEVWVKLDAYESDLPWLRYGQPVKFTTEAYPGETFTGRIAFIDPVVNSSTRTIKVRVNVANPEGKLKPDMFVRGLVRAKVASGGRVMNPDLAGKWMCPMHPDVVKDGPDKCTICGMPLARTESLGYVAVDETENAKPLVIPVSAPLVTGERAVVYVRKPDARMPTFEGREIELGPRAGDFYIVHHGLREGELVVTHGNFKIDSALQIQAKPSMMSPEGGAPPPGHQHGQGGTAQTMAQHKRPETPDTPETFRAQLEAVWRAYLHVAAALADDDFETASSAAQSAGDALEKVNMALLRGESHMAWMKELPNLRQPLAQMVAAEDIEHLRAGFALLSDELAVVIGRFGVGAESPVHVLKCPMAFNNRGATWLQDNRDVRNPYFGAQMLSCGSVVRTIQAGMDEEDRRHE